MTDVISCCSCEMGSGLNPHPFRTSRKVPGRYVADIYKGMPSHGGLARSGLRVNALCLGQSDSQTPKLTALFDALLPDEVPKLDAPVSRFHWHTNGLPVSHLQSCAAPDISSVPTWSHLYALGEAAPEPFSLDMSTWDHEQER